MGRDNSVPNAVDWGNKPDDWPTQHQSSAFWESLGRAVTTFGFLEEVLRKAVFVFTSNNEGTNAGDYDAYCAWAKSMEIGGGRSFHSLIADFSSAVAGNGGAPFENFELLIDDLRRVALARDALCRGSWSPPDSSGASLSRVEHVIGEAANIQMTPADLNRLQLETAGVGSGVIATVLFRRWQFPGGLGPGEVALQFPQN